MEHERNSDTSYNWCTRNNPQKLGKQTGRLGNKRTSGDHPDFSILKIGQNTDKSPRDLKIIVCAYNPVKDQQVTLI